MNKVISVGRILNNIAEVKTTAEYVEQGELLQARLQANIELSRIMDEAVSTKIVEDQAIDDAITQRMYEAIHRNHKSNKRY